MRAALLLPPIYGPAWRYRHRARLSVRHVEKKGGVLVGFHERKSSYVADMTSCQVLPPAVEARLAVEAASPFGWERYVGDAGEVIGMNRFGESAPWKVLADKFGFTPDAVAKKAMEYLAKAGK